MENLEFRVSGEIRVLDNTSLVSVNLFSMQRIFIGDNAAFQGDALAMGNINVYGNAEVIGKSSLIAIGSQNFMPKSGVAQSRYAILISESAVFDGTAIALGDLGGLRPTTAQNLPGSYGPKKRYATAALF